MDYPRGENYNNILTTTIDRKEEPNHNLKNRLILHISERFKCAVPLQPKPI